MQETVPLHVLHTVTGFLLALTFFLYILHTVINDVIKYEVNRQYREARPPRNIIERILTADEAFERSACKNCYFCTCHYFKTTTVYCSAKPGQRQAHKGEMKDCADWQKAMNN